MKMYLIQWHIVDRGLCLAEQVEGTQRKGAGFDRDKRFVQNRANRRQVAAVVMMCVIMVVMVMMRVRFMLSDQHTRFARGNTAAVYRFEAECRPQVERCGGL